MPRLGQTGTGTVPSLAAPISSRLTGLVYDLEVSLHGIESGPMAEVSLNKEVYCNACKVSELVALLNESWLGQVRLHGQIMPMSRLMTGRVSEGVSGHAAYLRRPQDLSACLCTYNE